MHLFHRWHHISNTWDSPPFWELFEFTIHSLDDLLPALVLHTTHVRFHRGILKKSLRGSYLDCTVGGRPFRYLFLKEIWSPTCTCVDAHYPCEASSSRPHPPAASWEGGYASRPSKCSCTGLQWHNFYHPWSRQALCGCKWHPSCLKTLRSWLSALIPGSFLFQHTGTSSPHPPLRLLFCSQIVHVRPRLIRHDDITEPFWVLKPFFPHKRDTRMHSAFCFAIRSFGTHFAHSFKYPRIFITRWCVLPTEMSSINAKWTSVKLGSSTNRAHVLIVVSINFDMDAPATHLRLAICRFWQENFKVFTGTHDFCIRNCYIFQKKSLDFLDKIVKLSRKSWQFFLKIHRKIGRFQKNFTFSSGKSADFYSKILRFLQENSRFLYKNH